MEMSILQALSERVLFSDGGYGSLFQSKGLPPGALGDVWNLEHPEIITAVHADYLRAGSDILTSNTFNTNALKFPDTGEYSVEEVIEAAFRNAREAIRQVPSDHERYVALDMGPTGKLLEPLGAEFVQAIGRKFTLYRRAKDKEKRQIVLPR